MPDALKDHEGISEIIWCKPFCHTIIKKKQKTKQNSPKVTEPHEEGCFLSTYSHTAVFLIHHFSLPNNLVQKELLGYRDKEMFDMLPQITQIVVEPS